MKNNAVFAVLIFLISCSGEQKPLLTEEEKGNIVLEVKEVLDRFNAEIKEGGLTTEFKYLDNSKDFHWTPPGYRSAISFDSVAGMLKKNAANYKEIENRFESLTIDAASADTAIYDAKITSVLTDTTNNPITVHLKEKGKLIKRKDGWKLLSGETTVSLTGE
jgi:hypothetical protein